MINIRMPLTDREMRTNGHDIDVAVAELKRERRELEKREQTLKVLKDVYHGLGFSWSYHEIERGKYYTILTKAGGWAVARQFLPSWAKWGVTSEEWKAYRREMYKRGIPFSTDLVHPAFEVISLADAMNAPCPFCKRPAPVVMHTTGTKKEFLVCCCGKVHVLCSVSEYPEVNESPTTLLAHAGVRSEV